MLEKIFTSKNRVKIIGFLLFNKNETYLREISKSLNVPVSAVKREIDNLEMAGIVIKTKNKISVNQKSSILDDLKNIFIKTEYITYPLKNLLLNKKIKFALIFGSFARGEYKKESDVDLLIIGDLKLSEGYKLLKPLEEKIKREINPVIWTIENLKKEKNSGFIKDIFKKKIIMVKGEENELRKIVE